MQLFANLAMTVAYIVELQKSKFAAKLNYEFKNSEPVC